MSSAPAVEMLWESADPAEQLTARFGFVDGAAAARWVAEVAERYWGLDVARCGRLVMSGRNAMAWVEANDRTMVVKWSAMPNRFARLQAAARVVVWLDTQGVPVAAPLASRDGRLLIELGNPTIGRLGSRLPLPGRRFLVGVLPVIGGDLLSVDDPAQVDAAARMLAELHQALATYPGPVGGRAPLVRRRRGQPVHNDYRSANILHDGERISAVLDFEEITHSTRAADLAKSAVLLATRYHDWGPTTEPVRAAYVAAYSDHAAVPLTGAERHEIERRVAALLKAFGWS